MPPLIHHIASAVASSGWRATVSSEMREPPEPPATTTGPRSSTRSSPASASAWIVDSVAPVKETLDSP